MVADKCEKATELGVVKELPIAPKISAEIGLFFDHDFPVEQVTEIMGLHPDETSQKSLTQINPITGHQNVGYWIHRIVTAYSFDCAAILLCIEKLLIEHAEDICKIKSQYDLESIMVRIYIYVEEEDEYPSIRLHPHLLNLLSNINASFDIVIENNYE